MLEATDGHVDKHAGSGKSHIGGGSLALLRRDFHRFWPLGIHITEFIMRSEKARIAFFVFLDILMFVPAGNRGGSDVDQILH